MLNMHAWKVQMFFSSDRNSGRSRIIHIDPSEIDTGIRLRQILAQLETQCGIVVVAIIFYLGISPVGCVIPEKEDSEYQHHADDSFQYVVQTLRPYEILYRFDCRFPLNRNWDVVIA